MSEERHPFIVAGAGVFGLAAALALAEAGRRVVLLDPHPCGPSASSVAAGLIAPVAEAVYDPDAAPHHALLATAAALWPEFAERHGLGLSGGGTRLFGVDLAVVRRFDPTARRAPDGVVQVSDRAIPDAAVALAGMKARLVALGGRTEHRRWSPQDPPGLTIVAVGAGASTLVGAAPELRWLRPIKGQIARAPRGPATGPVVRWPGGYLAPAPGGARIGATMEFDVHDTTVDPEAIARLGQTAGRYVPDLDLANLSGEAGVRMTTPDGLPLVGRSRSGAVIAVGARRNGWLLAPLVGAMAAAYVTGQEPGPWARLMDPQRFGGA